MWRSRRRGHGDGGDGGHGDGADGGHGDGADGGHGDGADGGHGDGTDGGHGTGSTRRHGDAEGIDLGGLEAEVLCEWPREADHETHRAGSVTGTLARSAVMAPTIGRNAERSRRECIDHTAQGMVQVQRRTGTGEAPPIARRDD
jgi:hypothetical protein